MPIEMNDKKTFFMVYYVGGAESRFDHSLSKKAVENIKKIILRTDNRFISLIKDSCINLNNVIEIKFFEEEDYNG